MPAPRYLKNEGTLVLPPQHPATLARHGKGPGADVDTASAIQQVFTPGFTSVLDIPLSAIRHLPAASLNVTRLVLCSKFDPAQPKGSCPMGGRCRFVHADVVPPAQRDLHVNYAWRSVADVTYERFPAGNCFHVAAPNSRQAVDTMDSSLVLKTKALAMRRPLSHCAHYYFNRTCNLGAECQFIHAVFVDPTAKDHQRAPAPAHLGREHRREKASSAVAASTPQRPASLPQPQAQSECAGESLLLRQVEADGLASLFPPGGESPRSRPRSDSSVSSAAASDEHVASLGASNSTVSPGTPGGASPQAPRRTFRHNPYAALPRGPIGLRPF